MRMLEVGILHKISHTNMEKQKTSEMTNLVTVLAQGKIKFAAHDATLKTQNKDVI